MTPTPTETPESLRVLADESDYLARCRPDDALVYEQQSRELRARAEELEREASTGFERATYMRLSNERQDENDRLRVVS